MGIVREEGGRGEAWQLKSESTGLVGPNRGRGRIMQGLVRRFVNGPPYCARHGAGITHTLSIPAGTTPRRMFLCTRPPSKGTTLGSSCAASAMGRLWNSMWWKERRPRQAQLPPQDAARVEGAAEPVSEGERADDAMQQPPRRRRPLPFFFRRRFVRGPRPPVQQQAQPVQGTEGAEPKDATQPEGDQQPPAQAGERAPAPRFRPRYRRPFRPRPLQQPTTEGGDGETKVVQAPADGIRPEPQRQRNRPYFQRRRQQTAGTRPAAVEPAVTASKDQPALSSAAGGDTPAASTPAAAQEPAVEASKPAAPAPEGPSQPPPEIQRQLVDTSTPEPGGDPSPALLA
ncbi:hypothetical protein KIL84_015135 [Mauremys mutica]|uniref:Uncharacterized protein n=1 Tax=Mauremys mutica TaxID=74926 RepID=A0A9D4BBS6_9SAUR|nr:hypothetical protein KIL84_015135 [Mauremys mutica]